ncbi:hypothetical protein TUBRATIS_001020 [Tubulinosema ratisbonensis]|uniref:Uncharacterized protein n=1 Tax=Tubulinosema ratisbonensis TaxID=291195 RepID=A0A437AQH8_9MICR|nr:hypothetical protein TUBRATIS_001020 [Tubulinosema ratisbonensis]
MKSKQVSEIMFSLQKSHDNVSWEQVQKKFTELTDKFSEHFPHLNPPKIIFEQTGISFHVKLHIFDTLIESAKSRRSKCVALLTMIDFGLQIIEANIEELSKEPDMPIVQESVITTIKKKKKKRTRRSGDVLDNDELAELGIGTHLHKSTNYDNNMISDAQETSVPGLKYTNENYNNEEKKIDYATEVKNFCKENKYCYPEYMFEKTNGLFICSAEFENEVFTSKYAYSKEDSKDEVCKMILEYINEHCKKKDQESVKENNKVNIESKKIYEESSEEGIAIVPNLKEDVELKNKLQLQKIKNMFFNKTTESNNSNQ